MSRDFGAWIKENPERFSIIGIQYTRRGNGALRLVAIVDDESGCEFADGFVEIICSNAVDYSIRPKRPSIIEGGPFIEYYEEHKLLHSDLQYIPGGDGEIFDPPIKFCLLILDQSYVIAERFEIRPYYSGDDESSFHLWVEADPDVDAPSQFPSLADWCGQFGETCCWIHERRS